MSLQQLFCRKVLKWKKISNYSTGAQQKQVIPEDKGLSIMERDLMKVKPSSQQFHSDNIHTETHQ